MRSRWIVGAMTAIRLRKFPIGATSSASPFASGAPSGSGPASSSLRSSLALPLGSPIALLSDPAGENNLANFLRSAAHGGSVGLTAWAVQTVFDSRVRSRLGAALSQLPLAAEIAVRALVMTAALIVVGILLQFVLYAAPLRLHWLTQEWLVTTLPRQVAYFCDTMNVAARLCDYCKSIDQRLVMSGDLKGLMTIPPIAPSANARLSRPSADGSQSRRTPLESEQRQLRSVGDRQDRTQPSILSTTRNLALPLNIRS
jgi:hypothetical protein